MTQIADRVGHRIGRISRILRRNMDKQVSAMFPGSEEAVTGRNGFVICYSMEHRNEDIFQRDFEKLLGVRRSTVSNMIDLMEQKGFLTRENAKNDSRMKKLVLTERGIEVHRRVEAGAESTEEKIKSSLSKSEYETLNDLLGRLEKILSEDSEKGTEKGKTE